MNTEEIMKLADAYAQTHPVFLREGTKRYEARAALEAALSAKQGEQALQDVSDPAPALLSPDNDPMVLRMAERISELEAQNAQLLVALRYFMSAVENSSHLDARRGIMAGAFDKAHAAIAAVESLK